MVKHIVLWKLKGEAGGAAKAETMKKMKAGLEALKGKVPSLAHIEVGVNFEASAACDVALYCEFASKADLEAYQVHPEHVAVATFIRSVVGARTVADYEV